MKISFLSVFPPYRGGIAQHSSQLKKYLSEKHQVQTINFKKLYPNIFFPGKNQFSDSSSIQGKRILSSINIITWFRTLRVIKKFKPDIFIFKFWNPFFVPCLYFILKGLKSNKQTKIIMVCDNIKPHESFPFSNFLIKKITRLVDGFIVQSSIVESELKTFINNPKYLKRFHPIYDNYPEKLDLKKARSKIKISHSKVILFFGLVRAYKGLDILLKSIKNIFKKNKDIMLLIVGESYEDENKYKKLILESGFQDRVIWINKFVSDNDVSLYFSAADLVVLPYKSASQSGVVPLAYNYEKPVVTSDLKSLSEVIVYGETGYTFKTQSELESIIIKFFENFDDKFYAEKIKEHKKLFSWEKFASSITELYDSINEKL